MNCPKCNNLMYWSVKGKHYICSKCLEICRAKPRISRGIEETPELARRRRLILAYEKCLSNARSYLSEAQILLSKGCYARAFGLSVLGVEEVGKARTCQSLALRQSTADEALIKLTRNHEFKQMIAERDILLLLFLSPLENFAEWLEGIDVESVDMDVLLQELETKDQELFEHWEKMGKEGTTEHKRSQEMLRSFRDLQKRREISFYVDVDFKSGGIRTAPSEITEKEVQLVIQILKMCIRGAGGISWDSTINEITIDS